VKFVKNIFKGVTDLMDEKSPSLIPSMDLGSIVTNPLKDLGMGGTHDGSTVPGGVPHSYTLPSTF